MKYNDKATIKQVNKHQNKYDDYGYMSNRQKERQRKRWLNQFRLKVPDKIWWDSLTIDEQTSVAHQTIYDEDGKNNLKYLMIKFPGNIAYIREVKLNKILIY
jgi:outer membrane lipoprotein-sorting protein